MPRPKEASTSCGPRNDADEAVACVHCGGTNLVEREERDDAVGYAAYVLWCMDCNQGAE